MYFQLTRLFRNSVKGAHTDITIVLEATILKDSKLFKNLISRMKERGPPLRDIY